MALPAAVKTMLQDGALSAGHARALLTAPDPEALAKAVTERNLSVRDIERLANQAKAVGTSKVKLTPRAAKSGAKHADLLALERDMTERLGLRVTIEGQGASGTLSIAYKSIDQLDGILEKLSRSK